MPKSTLKLYAGRLSQLRYREISNGQYRVLSGSLGIPGETSGIWTNYDLTIWLPEEESPEEIQQTITTLQELLESRHWVCVEAEDKGVRTYGKDGAQKSVPQLSVALNRVYTQFRPFQNRTLEPKPSTTTPTPIPPVAPPIPAAATSMQIRPDQYRILKALSVQEPRFAGVLVNYRSQHFGASLLPLSQLLTPELANTLINTFYQVAHEQGVLSQTEYQKYSGQYATILTIIRSWQNPEQSAELADFVRHCREALGNTLDAELTFPVEGYLPLLTLKQIDELYQFIEQFEHRSAAL